MASSADGALYSLKYSSILNIPQEQVDPTLSVILAAALKNNPKHDITGMMYVDRHSKALVQVSAAHDGPVRPSSVQPRAPSLRPNRCSRAPRRPC